ncbi:ATP-binding protein [Rhizobium sp. SL42]|uniref:ATP-binding protein n=1 Tax=Rhizobium sp. SL42 TaxID=2806346 RepID=UPI001F01712F|nr:AAA family ATPase [Rhizobium sp. SL42]UJW77161.1 ATPase [Rhizobium sp. SL42]
MRSKAANNLPAATTNVVGRDAFIDLIQSEVKRCGLVSIVGAGGIGKTTVALAIADRALGTFGDGVWLVDFAPLREPVLVSHSIANATGLTVHSSDALAALCRFLQNRNMLLVLDNCEHLLETIAACVRQIQAEAPGIRILCTSRAPLGLEGEQIHRLPGLEIPPPGTTPSAETALQYSAIQLFVDRARDRVETFVLTDSDAPKLADICRSLDGIALAIELAAMRVDVFGIAELQRQLEDRFRLLAGRRAGMERHRTMAATLDWSYGLLPDREAELLMAVSIFAGSFQAEDVATAFDHTPSDTIGLLRELVAQSLLSIDETGERAVYRLLESTRAYCLSKLALNGKEDSIRLRHAIYICGVLELAANEWKHSQSREWGARHGRHLDDLRAALGWAGSDPQHSALLIRLTVAAIPLWNHFSLTDERRAHLTRAIAELENAGQAGTAVEMNLQIMLGGALLFTRGNVPDVLSALSRSLEIADQLGDTTARLQCLRIKATYELFAGQLDAGIHTLETFLPIASTDDISALPEGETHLGVGELCRGRLITARHRMERLHAQIPPDFNNQRFAQYQYSNSVNAMIVLSHAQWLTGYPDAGEQMIAKSLEYARQAEHELSYSIALAWACLLFQWAGRETDCEHHAIILDELCERHGIVIWRPIATFCRGAVAATRPASLAEGIDRMQDAIADFRTIGHLVRLPYFLSVLAEALARQGWIDAASARIEEALVLAYEQNERWCLPEIIRINASIVLAKGQVDTAEALLKEAIAAADEIDASTWRLRASNDLARLWQGQSRTEEAVQMLRPAFTDIIGTKSKDIVRARETLARLK